MLNLNDLEDIVFDDVNYLDYPDFSDAYISEATIYGRELTEDELDWVNEQTDFVHEQLMEQTF